MSKIKLKATENQGADQVTSINLALLEELIKQAEVLKESLPAQIDIDERERTKLPRASKSRWFFTEKALEYAQQHPVLMPTESSKEKLIQTAELMHHINALNQSLTFIQRKCQDMEIAVSIKLFRDARMIYQQAKLQALQMSGMKGIYQELKALISPKKNKNKISEMGLLPKKGHE